MIKKITHIHEGEEWCQYSDEAYIEGSPIIETFSSIIEIPEDKITEDGMYEYSETYEEYEYFYNEIKISFAEVLKRKNICSNILLNIEEIKMNSDNSIVLKKIENSKKINRIKTKEIKEKIISLKKQNIDLNCKLLQRDENSGLFFIKKKDSKCKIVFKKIETNKNGSEYIHYSYYSQGLRFKK